jgi:hypothetical protein
MVRRATKESAAANTTPPATRSKRPTWREPRLLMGVALIAISVLLGAKLMAALDDTVGVFVVKEDLAKGSTLTSSDLRATQIRFADAATADLYVSSDDSISGSASLNRDLKAGELLPRQAMDSNATADLVELPISVDSTDLPTTVRQGSTVDVWVTSKAAGSGPVDLKATLVLPEALVISVPGRSDSFAPEATKQVILGVPAKDTEKLAQALGVLADGRVVITRRN